MHEASESDMQPHEDHAAEGEANNDAYMPPPPYTLGYDDIPVASHAASSAPPAVAASAPPPPLPRKVVKPPPPLVKPPPPPPQAAASPADPQWIQVRDPASGHMYYSHRVTGESTWVQPPVGEFIPADSPPQQGGMDGRVENTLTKYKQFVQDEEEGASRSELRLTLHACTRRGHAFSACRPPCASCSGELTTSLLLLVSWGFLRSADVHDGANEQWE